MYCGPLTVKALAASGCGRGLPPALAQGGLGCRRGTNPPPAGTMPGATGTAAAGNDAGRSGGPGLEPHGAQGWLGPTPPPAGGTPLLAGGAAEHNIK